MKTTWRAIVLVIICTLLTSVAQVFWKQGAQKLPVILTNWEILAGFVLYGTAAALLVTAFKTGEVSVLFPIIATSYIWVAIFSWFFLGEIITMLKIFGIAGR